LHLAYFRGVDNADEIKELILGRLKRLRDSGLGDPDEAAEAEAPDDAAVPAPALAAGGGEALAAARELLAEARGLRRALVASG
ncbi:MAG TPA: PH domain-containing protein, partial [Thermoanaerobaculia bacterium]|nr:PH domain-containing protein [Thermoanaerobaculia bacterium]